MALEGYPARARELVSSVQRLRGWVGTDPSRQPELADELVALTAARLAAQAFAEAAADARESLALAGRLLASHGPLGPYTPVADATRFVAAAVQFGAVQAGLGLAEAAGRTVATAEAALAALPELRLRPDPDTCVRALLVLAAAGLAAGEVGPANAMVDGAVGTLGTPIGGAPATTTGDASPLLALQTALAVAECRDAAGRPREALAWAAEGVRLARAGLDLSRPGQLPPARLERLAAPALPTWRALADRLAAAGEVGLGLAAGRELVALLEPVAARLPAAATHLALARAGLAADLLGAGRPLEALDLARTALAAPGAEVAEPLRLVLGRALLAGGDAEAAVGALQRLVEDSLAHDEVTAADAEALEALAEAQAAIGGEAAELRAAAAQARAALPSAPAPVTGWPEPSGDFVLGPPGEAAARTRALVAALEADLARDRAGAEASEAAVRGRFEAAAAARRDAELAAAQLAAEQAAEEEAAAARQQAEAEQAEAERRKAAEAAEREQTKRRRQERLARHDREVRQREAAARRAELAEALAAAHDPAERERLELALLEHDLAQLEAEEADQLRDQETGPETGAEAAERPFEELRDREAEAEESRQSPSKPLPDESADQPFDELREREAETEESRQSLKPLPDESADRPFEDLREREAETEESRQSPKPLPDESTDRPFDELRDRETEEQRLSLSKPLPEEPAPAPSALGAALETVEWARDSGDRRALRTGLEDLVDLLRPRATAEPSRHGADLVAALQELAALRLRGGDWWGSRAPAKEAKALARQWGLD